jgi:hypothetical protein
MYLWGVVQVSWKLFSSGRGAVGISALVIPRPTAATLLRVRLATGKRVCLATF